MKDFTNTNIEIEFSFMYGLHLCFLYRPEFRTMIDVGSTTEPLVRYLNTFDFVFAVQPLADEIININYQRDYMHFDHKLRVDKTLLGNEIGETHFYNLLGSEYIHMSTSNENNFNHLMNCYTGLK